MAHAVPEALAAWHGIPALDLTTQNPMPYDVGLDCTPAAMRGARPTCAWLPALTKVLQRRHPGVVGVCLSGAGPSVLAFPRGNTQAIAQLVQQTLREEGVESRVYSLAADNLGPKGWCLPK